MSSEITIKSISDINRRLKISVKNIKILKFSIIICFMLSAISISFFSIFIVKEIRRVEEKLTAKSELTDLFKISGVEISWEN